MPLSFLRVNILKDLCLIAARPKGQRSHERERGTHECVRHNVFNNLYQLWRTKSYIDL
jgi:hypothetical protein